MEDKRNNELIWKRAWNDISVIETLTQNKKRILTVQKVYVDGGCFRVKIYNKEDQLVHRFYEDDDQVAKLKAQILARNLGWKIAEIK